MPLPSTLYVTPQNTTEVLKLTGVVDWKYMIFTEPNDTYRDTGWAGGKGRHEANAGSTNEYVEEVPIVGLDGTTVPTAMTVDKLLYATPDEMAHIPPRVKFGLQKALVVSFVSALPAPLSTNPTGYTRAVASANISDVITLAAESGNPGFNTGDVVRTSWTGSGISAGVNYTVIRDDTTLIRLMDSSGAVVNITATTATPGSLVMVAPIQHYASPYGLSGVLIYPGHPAASTDLI